ncbi:hypothetical protein XF_2587 [Xylella fastidiosa 9a5c]|uniref:Uncharacterized protein n=1 Tax=Xylella fastidiosa (strain 9a5c) TaxID=160492 RepID=Q9PAD1_XYLFA|nr:hypothetical protein XF_2587 [Xylella fastidiosa 9a5c]
MFSAALHTIAKGIPALSLQRSASKIHLATAIDANAIPNTPQERHLHRQSHDSVHGMICLWYFSDRVRRPSITK